MIYLLLVWVWDLLFVFDLGLVVTAHLVFRLWCLGYARQRFGWN